MTQLRLPKPQLQNLIDLLWQQGFRVLGPVVRNGAVVFDDVRCVADMPIGLRDEQVAFADNPQNTHTGYWKHRPLVRQVAQIIRLTGR